MDSDNDAEDDFDFFKDYYKMTMKERDSIAKDLKLYKGQIKHLAEIIEMKSSSSSSSSNHLLESWRKRLRIRIEKEWEDWLQEFDDSNSSIEGSGSGSEIIEMKSSLSLSLTSSLTLTLSAREKEIQEIMNEIESNYKKLINRLLLH